MNYEQIMQVALNNYAMKNVYGEWSAPIDNKNQLTEFSSEV